MVYKTAQIAYGSAGLAVRLKPADTGAASFAAFSRRATTAAGAILTPVVAAFRVPLPGEILCD
jgi:hypothetical protein